MGKQAWRQRLQAAVAAMGAPRRQAADGRIRALLLAHPLLRRARCVGLYAALPSEVQLAPLDAQLRGGGVRCAYPVLPPAPAALRFAVPAAVAELRRARLGVAAPPATAPQLGLDELDVMLVPGLGVDATGHRLGRGGGYYDRTLANYPGPSVAVIYEAQRVAALPHEAHDRAVDVVVTEAGAFAAAPGRGP